MKWLAIIALVLSSGCDPGFGVGGVVKTRAGIMRDGVGVILVCTKGMVSSNVMMARSSMGGRFVFSGAGCLDDCRVIAPLNGGASAPVKCFGSASFMCGESSCNSGGVELVIDDLVN